MIYSLCWLTDTQCSKMPDYLSCGGCQSDFELSDILQFIEHKRYNCNVSTTDFAMELLECVKCLRKFHTPWPLLLHVQSEHHIAVVRNLVLPSITTSISRPTTNLPVMSTKSAQTQTVKTCLKRLVCPYQANLPAECCLKVEAPSEDSCCCLETGEKTDSSNEMATCQSFVLNSSESRCTNNAIANSQKRHSSNGSDKSQPKGTCPCESNSFTVTATDAVSTRQNVCCSTSNNMNSQCNATVARSRVQSCCDPTQTLLPVPRNSESCVAKTVERTRISTMYQNASTAASCCPCKPSNTVDQTCQTDFAETFDIDMDLLLDTDDLNVAIESTFQDDNNSHSTMLAPSKAIQTVVHGNNLGNCTVPSQTLMPAEMIAVTSESSQSGTRAYHSNSVAQSEQPLTQSINHYRNTFATPREEVRGPYLYNQENATTLEHINADNSLQVWENQEVTETVEVDNSESLLHLLGSSAAITASFTKSHMSQRQTTQLMQSTHGIPGRAHHSLQIETNETKRKRNVRDYRFNCSECDKVFRQNVHLRKHVMAKHTKQKPHKCTYCRYTTVEKSHLTVHIRTHTGEKPFRCRICNYSTAQNCTLKSHYLRKHPDSKVKCGICGMDFITNHERDKHEKVCRRDDTYVSIDAQHLPETTIFSKLSTSSDGGHDLVDQSV